LNLLMNLLEVEAAVQAAQVEEEPVAAEAVLAHFRDTGTGPASHHIFTGTVPVPLTHKLKREPTGYRFTYCQYNFPCRYRTVDSLVTA
jgi:hypothetical protein